MGDVTAHVPRETGAGHVTVAAWVAGAHAVGWFLGWLLLRAAAKGERRYDELSRRADVPRETAYPEGGVHDSR